MFPTIAKIFVSCLFLAGCQTIDLDIDQYKVTKIYIDKSHRELFLLSNNIVLRKYDIALGFDPIGHKRFQGDGKTPEGIYKINRKNPQSMFKLSLGIDYPNKQDRDFARRHGKDPGGDIFIHGQDIKEPYKAISDWTYGCIAVSDVEIEEIFKFVSVGTVVEIVP